jgi:hypothetical protein
MRKFLKTSTTFCLGLVAAVAAGEAGAARFMARRQALTMAGAEVYLAQSLAGRRDDRVQTIYLGDSVARQIFRPGSEADSSVQFLATNQAVSVAGQYYLLRDAVATHANLRHVSLFYNPLSWSNNLDQVFTHDYFCGYFHRLNEVREVFALTGDWSLLAAHLGRVVLPNLLAANAYMSMNEARHSAASRPVSGHTRAIQVSRVSAYFLDQMRDFTGSRGIRLTVYPAPVSDEFRYRDEVGLYDAPIVYLPRDEFVADGIHLKQSHERDARAELVARFSLLGAPRMDDGAIDLPAGGGPELVPPSKHDLAVLRSPKPQRHAQARRRRKRPSHA